MIRSVALFAILSLSFCEGTSKLGRRHVLSEEEVTRDEYMYIIDGEGNVHFEYLRHEVKDVELDISDVQLYLYTKGNPNGEIISVATLEDLINSQYYNPSLKNAFSAHGWNSGPASDVNVETWQAILNSGNEANFFVIDWHIPAGQFYTLAVSSIPLVAQIIAEYINQMIIHYNIQASDFILIGESLGAHVVGCVGASVNGSVAQIVGLDPAYPMFSLSQTDNRLDETDAQVVHVAHTNGGFQGFLSSIGDADYFFNGGVKQPGCGPDITNSCSHKRAMSYYAESIISSGFKALLCSSHEEFLDGSCDGNREVLFGGFPLEDSIVGDYYLDTAESPPFALG